MGFIDKRQNLRISDIHAKFEFKGKQYDILNLSHNGVLIESETGFEDKVIEQLSSGKFDFKLVDPATNSEMYFVGKMLRCVENKEVKGAMRMAIAFEAKKKRTAFSYDLHRTGQQNLPRA